MQPTDKDGEGQCAQESTRSRLLLLHGRGANVYILDPLLASCRGGLVVGLGEMVEMASPLVNRADELARTGIPLELRSQ